MLLNLPRKTLRQFDSFVRTTLGGVSGRSFPWKWQPQNARSMAASRSNRQLYGMLDNDCVQRGDVFRRALKKFVRENGACPRPSRFSRISLQLGEILLAHVPLNNICIANSRILCGETRYFAPRFPAAAA